MEAVIGATYLSAGPDAATALVLRLVEPLLADPERYGAAMDPKTSLQELASRIGAAAAAVLGRRPPGPITTACSPRPCSSGTVSAPGVGTSKKHAEMAAALPAWRELSERA